MEQPTMEPQNQTNLSNTNDGKTIAIISYLTVIGLIIAFVMNNDKKNAFASYHIRQSLGIMLTGLALGIIGIIPILGWIVAILGFIFVAVLWIMGIISAANEKTDPVPLLGPKYQEWLKGI